MPVNCYLDQQYSHVPSTTQKPEATLGDYAIGAGKGIVKGGASLLDQFLTPTLQGISDMIPGGKDDPNESGARDIAERYLPTSTKAGPAAVEGATEGAVGNAPFGPMGSARGAIQQGTTNYLNNKAPDHPIRNTLVGAGVSLATPITTPLSIGKSILQATGKVAEDNPIFQAERDLGITNRNAAMLGPENSWRRTVRDLRESPLSSAINDRELARREQLEGAFDRMAPPTTMAEAGCSARTGLINWKDSTRGGLDQREQIINNHIDPKTTMVDGSTVISQLEKEFAPPSGASYMRDPGADTLLQKIKDSIMDYAGQQQYGSAWSMEGGYKAMGYKPSSMQIPLEAMQYIRKQISDDFHASISGTPQDTSTTNLKIAYGAVADAEKQAYAGTGFANLKDDLNQDWKHYFDNLEQVQHLLPQAAGSKAQTLGKGEVYADVVSSIGKDADHLDNVLKLVPPDARQDIANAKIRDMAFKPSAQGNPVFDPGQFAKEWHNVKKMSPEAKQYLFGNSIPDYDKLALAAQEQARSEASRNTSGTAGVNLAFKSFIGFASAGAAAGAGYDYYNNNGMNWWSRAGEAGGSGLLGGLLTASVGARLFSNPGFVRLLATNPPIEALPHQLSLLAAANPNMKNDFDAFSSFAKHQIDRGSPQLPQPGSNIDKFLDPSSRPQDKKFSCGGYAQFSDQAQTAYLSGGPVFGNSMPGPGQREPIDQQGYALGGLTKTQPNAKSTKTQQAQCPVMNYPRGYEEGGFWLDNASRAQMGRADNNNRPSILRMLMGAYSYPWVKNSNPDTGMSPAAPMLSGANQNSKIPGFVKGGSVCGQPDTATVNYNKKIALTDHLRGGGGIWGTQNANGGLGFAQGGLDDVEPVPAKELACGGYSGSILDMITQAQDRPRDYGETDTIPMPPSAGRDALDYEIQRSWFQPERDYEMRKALKSNAPKEQELAQGGIAKSIDDPRPFYNCQLPRVTGGGWANGGAVHFAGGGAVGSEKMNTTTEINGWASGGIVKMDAGGMACTQASMMMGNQGGGQPNKPKRQPVVNPADQYHMAKGGPSYLDMVMKVNTTQEDQGHLRETNDRNEINPSPDRSRDDPVNGYINQIPLSFEGRKNQEI